MNYYRMYLTVHHLNETISERNVQIVEVEKEFFKDLEKVLRKGIREIPRLTALFDDITNDND